MGGNEKSQTRILPWGFQRRHRGHVERGGREQVMARLRQAWGPACRHVPLRLRDAAYCGAPGVLSANQDRQLGMRQHLGRLAAQQQCGDSAPAMGGHDDQVAFLLFSGLDNPQIGLLTGH